MLENVTYDEIEIGQTATYTKTVSDQDLKLFALVSGDVNPVHMDEEFAKTTPFGGRIAHGMYTGALVSAALAMELPGPGTVYLNQSLKFKAPVMINDTITVNLEVTAKRDDRKFVTLDCKITNQHGKVVAAGEAMVIAPSEKMSIPAPTLPTVTLS
jgi:acyl dehydratase